MTFSPDDSLRSVFPDDYQGTYFTDQLQTIAAGTKLFSVFAQAEPNSDKVHIGDLILTSEITKSKYGDETLFFKHQNMNEDVALRPDWKDALDPTKKKLESSGGTAAQCPFAKLKSFLSNPKQEAKKLAATH